MVLKVEKNFVTTRDAARLLGVALSTIQLWAENGILCAWRTSGGHRRIARNSVERLLLQQRAVIENRLPEKEMTIVVVEDEPLLLQLYQEHITDWGFALKVVTAINGFEGLINIGRLTPDVIITDMVMPGFDGFQMIEALKNFPALKHSLIIIVSNLAEQEINNKVNFTQNNMAYFRKPIPFECIKKTISQRILYLQSIHAFPLKKVCHS